MIIQGGSKSNVDDRLADIYTSLDDEARRSLIDYAEFLASRCEPEETVDIEIKHLPRPDEESVVAAIKRLSDVYHMIDRSKMLHETSGLMGEHLMQGREASEVIDDLEVLFQKYYEKQFGNGSEE